MGLDLTAEARAARQRAREGWAMLERVNDLGEQAPPRRARDFQLAVSACLLDLRDRVAALERR